MAVSMIVRRGQNRANAWSFEGRVYGYCLDRRMRVRRSDDIGSQRSLGTEVVGITPLALDKPNIF
jgi:hypothetical protein